MTEQAWAAERERLRALWASDPEPTACIDCGLRVVRWGRDPKEWVCSSSGLLHPIIIVDPGNPEALAILDALERAEQERDAAWERLEVCDTLHGHALGEVKTLTEERDQANAGVVVLLLKFERIYDFHNARSEDGLCTCEWCEIYRDLQTDAAATGLLKRAGRAGKLASAALLELDDGQGQA